MYERFAKGAFWMSKNRSLKIEQYEISSTEKCRDLVKTLWKKKLKQVKREARQNSSEKGINPNLG